MTAPLLDDCAGRIARAAVAISGFSADTFSQAIRNVLTALPEDAQLEVFAEFAAQDRLLEWLEQAGRPTRSTIHSTPDGLNFSLWLQDALLIRRDGTAEISPAFDRYDDLNLARHVVGALDLPVAEAAIPVDGGNVITHGRFAVLSADSGVEVEACRQFDPSRTVLPIGTSAPCASEETRATDRPMPGWRETLNYLSKASTHQPIFHLDHMIAAAGHNGGTPRFLVGCPRSGAETAEHPMWPHAQPEAFDEIAQVLRDHGADVIRNPQPLAWVDRPEQSYRRWFHLPVNNVLIDGSTVLLPCFANESWPELAAVDEANTALWQGLGFDVAPIPGMMQLAEAMGGPRCMVKVLERTPA
ncbi:MAG: hypothetical protein AAGD13_02285 [Pseudomonadota bacterium]